MRLEQEKLQQKARLEAQIPKLETELQKRQETLASLDQQSAALEGVIKESEKTLASVAARLKYESKAQAEADQETAVRGGCDAENLGEGKGWLHRLQRGSKHSAGDGWKVFLGS